MSSKKDFSSMNTGRISAAIADATADPAEAQAVQEAQEAHKTNKARKTYTEQEKQEFLQNMKTNGRKGVKLPRINIAFTPDVYEYCRTMARAAGISYTEFVNTVLRQHKDEHADTFKKAIEFRDSL